MNRVIPQRHRVVLLIFASLTLAVSSCDCGSTPGTDGGSSGSDASSGTDAGDSDGGCTLGTEGCACNATGGCDAPLVCDNSVCVTPTASEGATISDTTARACEMLFEQRGTNIIGATYGTDVKGALRKRPPNVAIAVSRGVDQPFEADSVILGLDGAGSGVVLQQSRCFDAAGAVISGATVEFNPSN
jgi:hypothetical protein